MEKRVIYHNGRICTHDPADRIAAAMVVENGTVLLVGPDEEAFKLDDGETRYVDLDGARVVPVSGSLEWGNPAQFTLMTGDDAGEGKRGEGTAFFPEKE